MNYPIWEILKIGGGSLIALISILHVYIAHLAVGGGFFLWLTDRKGIKENDPQITSYVKRHTWFFLLLTMVFGGVSGVGIWFIIALVNPATTSVLIHNFVFGWAIEWVFFVGEIAALLIYHYKFDALTTKERLNIAFLYFLFAWLSLFVINGILSFMLTPSKWLETHNFWDGFFNPTFLPSLFFRTFMAVIIAGLFGYVTIVIMKKSEFRARMMRYCSKWLLYPFGGLVLSAAWYFYSVPENLRFNNITLNPQSLMFIYIFISASIILFIAGVIQALRSPLFLQRGLTVLLLLIGLSWIGGFEYLREIMRKPFTISNYIYSTSMAISQIEQLNREGVLRNARWSPIKEITPDNQVAAGRELFSLECSSCHTVGGIRNDIVPRIKGLTFLGMISHLTGQGKIQSYMPPFVGTGEEKEALALYLTSQISSKNATLEPASLAIKELADSIPAFDREKDDYVLLAWNDLGMHCVSDADAWFVFLPPANTLEAQLIERGPTPQIINDSIELTYRIEEGFENPAAQVEFWKYSESNFGKKLDKNVGLSGNGLGGNFVFNAERNSFIAAAIPVVPYKDDDTYNPYPIFNIEARDLQTGKVLMTTKVVAPVSTEMGCRNCHEGDWRVNRMAGLGPETAKNILAVHDRLNRTNLTELAESGKPQLCQSCHADPALAAEGKPNVLRFSAAMHGWHANYIPYEDARACGLCHPAFPKGNTRCMRDLHNSLDVTCVDCHGTIQEHAISLLKGQKEHPAAGRLMANLKAKSVTSMDDVKPRIPWVNEPDCLTCHRDFEKPRVGANGFNTWNDEFSQLYRMRSDNAGIRCPACHGSTHALYPARNPFGQNRDNLQPMQYSDTPLPIGSNFDCEVCHKIPMKDAIHHENMERMFRNNALIK